jgi:hypothetical protein
VASDAFAPQGQVKLYSNVTYRGEPVMGKPVAYRIIGPIGTGYEFLAVQFSNEDGLALLEFSIPASKSYFGIWNVSASVDIAGQIITDYVFFRVGWLIEVKSITIKPEEGTAPIPQYGDIQKVYKGRKYTVSVTLKIITMQHPTKCVQLDVPESKVILAYSGFDELKQPLFGAYYDITASIGVWKASPTVAEMESFVLGEGGRPYNNGQVEIEIPRSAYTGVGTIYANIFTDYPWLKGVPYSDPEIGSSRVWIQRPPV